MAYYAIIEYMEPEERRKFDAKLDGPKAPPKGRSKGTTELMRVMSGMGLGPGVPR